MTPQPYIEPGGRAAAVFNGDLRSAKGVRLKGCHEFDAIAHCFMQEYVYLHCAARVSYCIPSVTPFSLTPLGRLNRRGVQPRRAVAAAGPSPME